MRFSMWYDRSDEDISMFLHVSQTWTRTTKPDVTVAVIIELNRRGTLKNALAGRNEVSLNKILNFLLKWVTLSNTHIVLFRLPYKTMAHIKLGGGNLWTLQDKKNILCDLRFINIRTIFTFSKNSTFSNLFWFLKLFMGDWVIFHFKF